MSFKQYIILPLAALLLLSQSFVSCQSDDDEGPGGTVAEYDHTYFNFIIAVGSGSDARTRAPLGGEEGDGRESGFADENEVSGITLILYQGNINAAGTTPIEHIRYYPVTKAGTWPDANASLGVHADEAYYTTGNRPLRELGVDVTKAYHVIVVANADLTSVFKAGTTTLQQVRDYSALPVIFNGTGLAGQAQNFIMSSENDALIDFPGTMPTDITDGKLFSFDNIRIERLAARIDFHTVGGTYATQDGDGHDYATPGYRYNVDGTTDQFVLTKATPFNLFTGSEYLIKRTDDATNPYLADETTTNWVIDPARADKDNTNMLTYGSRLSDVMAETDATYSISSTELNTTAKGFDLDGNRNVVLAYTRENTLLPKSHLYKYATGICLQGDLYPSGSASDLSKRVTIKVYGYLRHQAESTEPFLIVETPLDGIECGSAVAMNYGVVRNNIYRVSIDHISDKGTIFLKLKVKKWDEFLHAYIYI